MNLKDFIKSKEYKFFRYDLNSKLLRSKSILICPNCGKRYGTHCWFGLKCPNKESRFPLSSIYQYLREQGYSLPLNDILEIYKNKDKDIRWIHT